MKSQITFALVLAVTMLLCTVQGDDAEPQKSDWMKRKLDYTQKILSGLAKGDYEAIRVNAELMNKLTPIERFIRGRTPAYRTQLQVFQFANEELIRLAEEKNIDGAALAFTQLTLSCVNCHKVIRDPEAE